MRVSIITVVTLFVLGLLLAGCGGPPGTIPATNLVFVTITPSSPGEVDTPPQTFATPPVITSAPTASLTPFVAITSLPTFTPIATLPSAPSLIVLTPTPTYSPYAIIDSPGGFLNVRQGPGLTYGTPLGTYSNGAKVEVIGKQYSPEGELWWLIPFVGGPQGRGWIFADYTIAYNVDQVPWVNPSIPLPPTVIIIPPKLPPVPEAIIDSPSGFVVVRSGPGGIYNSVGTYRNGTIVDILGKQFSKSDELWWLIYFPSVPYEEGWVYANYTVSKYTEGVPWVSAPPTPTPTTTAVPTGQVVVNWTITGRVVDQATAQPVIGASIRAELGTDGLALLTVTDSSGNFSMTASARNSGDLKLTITASGYADRVVTAGPRSPRVYDFPTIDLTPITPPAITWAIMGRVTEIGTTNPIPGAAVEAILGDDGVRIGTATEVNGQFSMSGEASDRGSLTVNITADGYQPNSFISDQTGSRIYNLNDLQLVPLAGSCAYESVINLPEASALAQLQTLSFTSVMTAAVAVGDQNLVGKVLSQQPNPPPEGQSSRLSCQIPISLGIGK